MNPNDFSLFVSPPSTSMAGNHSVREDRNLKKKKGEKKANRTLERDGEGETKEMKMVERIPKKKSLFRLDK